MSEQMKQIPWSIVSCMMRDLTHTRLSDVIWWEVTNGVMTFKCETEQEAKWLLNVIISHYGE